MERKPVPLIQNHIGWCWAVCARLLGEQCKTKLASVPFSLDSLEEQYPFGMPTDGLSGYRAETLGCFGGVPTVDLWQWVIVHASGAGMAGTASDGVKERAVRFVATGDPDSASIVARTHGQFASGQSLYPFYIEVLCGQQREKACFIGNCQIIGKATFHSVYAEGGKDRVNVYDPWDGASFDVSPKQLFESGFDTALGMAVVKWVQYVDMTK